ncbi:hypothetical protein [Neisseria blantyrii]|uniref:hypothetical protein n=1 Tax=Neisseria blantyrii TaxID=2830647 RepID=UPI00265AD2BF|nr:hypothetical protein [Neisseria blantyrii]
MPFETSAAVGGYLVNIGVIGIAGTLFGLPLDALILGGLTGAVVQGLRPVSTRRAGFFSIMLSMLLAGALTPLLMDWTAKHIVLSDGGEELLRPLFPVAIGGCWPWLIPLLRDYALSWVKKKTEG